jgi:hypothetical protein
MTEAVVTPAPAPAPASEPAPAAPWHGLTDPEGATYVGNKGWQSAADVVKSYQGAEKLIGRDPSTLLQMPRADDPAGFREVMSKLGLPASPDKYEFDKPEGLSIDEGYQTWAKQAFHKAGVPAPVAKALVAEHNAHVKAQLDARDTEYKAAVTADKAALLKEWGGGHERMLNAAQTAAKSLGFTGEMVDALEQSLGYAGTMKFFAQLGQKLGEDNFVSESSRDGGRFSDTMTPAEAKAAWEGMKIDPTMRAALSDNQHPGHKAAKEKQTRLFGIMYPVER